jgi:hypothetical protein
VRAPLAICALFLAAVASGGCGSSSVTTPPAVVESAQAPAKLPPGWRRHLDNSHGFSMGLPPGWALNDNGDSILLRSPDHLVALSLSVDRTADAFASPPPAFARQTLVALPGYEDKLVPGPPQKLTGTPLEASIVRSRGVTSKEGVHQDVEVAVLRRDTLVNYTGVIAANAASTPAPELGDARRILQTIRDLPIS